MNRHLVVAALGMCGALSLQAAKERPDLYVQDSTRPWATRESARRHRPVPERVREIVPGILLVEAEGFEDYGPWRLDSQFVHKMGSPYLIASGVGVPIGSARTTVDIPRAGTWRVWARTKDWLPEYSPGAFEVVVNGKSGLRLGASRRVGWLWEQAGDFVLAEGPARLELHDLSGYFGRCDALVLTTDLTYIPPDEPKALAAERYRLRGESSVPFEKGCFDVIVVGAGPGGCPAAIAAARHGVRVALIGDRPVLGGNSSDEIGVQMCGAAVDKQAARETGIVEEANCLRARYRSPAMSDAFARLVSAETNLMLFLNERMTEVETKDGQVAAVICRNMMTGLRSRYEAKVFVDATGDAWLGYYAGAEYREGREGKDEHCEKYAPNHPDTLTMSGLLQEPSVGVSYWAEKTNGPVAYQAPEWGSVLPRGFKRVLYSIFGTWWLEHPAWIDDCANPEEARDELIRISFGFWEWMKNKSQRAGEARNYRLREIPIFAGRRETRRLVGDYVLTSTDLIDGRDFPDAVAYGGWDLDLHDPLGMRGIDTNGHRFEDVFLPFYSIPYRSLYSRNVANLMMAGRDISVTHLALGSTRVQQTCAVIGQAVGPAAAMCIEYGVSPREIGQRHVQELQQRLLKDDAWIPGRRNTDPADLARSSSVSASSSATETRRFMHGKVVTYVDVAPENVIDGVSRPVGRKAHAWVSAPGAPLPQWIRLDFPKPVMAHEIRLTFDTDLEFNAWRMRTAGELVRDYVVEGTADGRTWFALAEEHDNFMRQRIHRFDAVRLLAVRLTVRKTYGLDEANVFEIRVY